MAVILDMRPQGLVAVFTLGIVVVIAIYQKLFGVRFHKDLPRLGRPPGKTGFSWRTRLRYYTDAAGLFQEAYDKVSFQQRGYFSHNTTRVPYGNIDPLACSTPAKERLSSFLVLAVGPRS